MPELQRLEDDLGYVRAAVHRSAAPVPRALYLLWALVVAVGFSLPDFAPRQVGLFWLIALPVGWGVSVFVGARRARSVGQRDARSAVLHLAHWGGMFVALGLLALMAQRGGIAWSAVGPLSILIVSLTYLLAGLHVDRALLLPGSLMAIGYAVLLFVESYSWTIVGALVAAGLVCSAFSGSPRRAVGSA